MRATIIHGAGDIRVERVADPELQDSTDVVVRVVRTRPYIDQLLPDALEGKIQQGQVFDRHVRLDEVCDDYRAMVDRRALKVLVRP